ncbi:MAG: flagellar biosynthesis protein FlgB [Planctomycetes bacterium]|nr:flagellar biosynthesis protein FlgB [Planctomycetota bacterium]
MDSLGDIGRVLQTALDTAATRHRVIGANIANVSTPGYKSKQVRFDAELGRAVEEEREGVAPREDGNTVMMELESAEMKKNQVAYDVVLMTLGQRMRLVRSAISGRGQ